MRRIAEAQRRLGRRIGDDAEAAWEDARRAAEAIEAASTSLVPPHPVTSLATGGPAAVRTTGSTTTPTFRKEVAALVQRIFDAPPFGAGMRCVMFCSAEPDGAAGLTQAIAERLADSPTPGRVAIVRIADGATPTIAATDSATRVLSVTAADAYYRVAELQASFDYVLFDAQLTATLPDTLITASAVEGIVLVVNERTTRRRTAQDMVDLLATAELKPFGVVLTDRSYPIPPQVYDWT
jgi:hypothetical protein